MYPADLDAALARLRLLLQLTPPGAWARHADAVVDADGGQLVWTTLAPGSHPAMDRIRAADPVTIGALLDELERRRGKDASAAPHADV